DLPFMFEDADEAHAALDGHYGDILKEKTREEGIEMLNTFSIGFSQITSNKQAINEPEDLNGASIRSQDEPVPIATFEALGSQVTTLSLKKVYLGLKQVTYMCESTPLSVI